MNVTLGARVRYHHRAAVARWMTKDFAPGEGRWGLFEGASKNAIRTDLDWAIVGVHETDLFGDLGPIRRAGLRDTLVNKTVMVWPEEGVGVVIGKVRRQRGTSHRSSYSSGAGGFEPDPGYGYFDSTETFELYAVRHNLSGLDYVLVPTWAVTLDDESERLRELAASYFVEAGRAPRNRDEAAIEAAATALVREVMRS